MEALNTQTQSTSSSSIAPVQTLNNTANEQTNQQTEAVGQAGSSDDEFSKFLMASLNRTGQDQVNEEELFSAIIGQRLSEDNTEAAEFYQQQFQDLSKTMARADGYVPVEDVAKAALKATADSGKITMEEADKINATAFAAAQLDENHDALYDGRGETSAIALMEEAMFKVKSVLEQVESGTMTPEARALDVPSNRGFTPGHLLMNLGEANANGILGAEGAAAGAVGEAALEGEGTEKQIRFTWKHEASDGNLAILLPTRLNGSIDGVSLYDSDGNLLEKGDYSKQTGDQRAVFRFNEPGGEYGNDVEAVVFLDDGSTISYHVDDGGERTYVPQDDGEVRSKSEWEQYRASLGGSSASSSSSKTTSSSNSSSESNSGSESSSTGTSSTESSSSSSSSSSSQSDSSQSGGVL